MYTRVELRSQIPVQIPGFPIPNEEKLLTTIKRADLVQSIADALQFISYYHPADYLRALGRAYEREQSPAAPIAKVLLQAVLNQRSKKSGRGRYRRHPDRFRLRQPLSDHPEAGRGRDGERL